MLERYDPVDSAVPAPVSARILKPQTILRQIADWSLVAVSFGLILFSTAALRPPQPQPVAGPVTSVVVATNR
jgi:hypothetical protein